VKTVRRALTALATAALVALAPLAAATAEEVAVVVNRTVYPGETIGLDTLQEVPLRNSKRTTAPIVQALEQAEGKVAKRTLLPGRLIPLASLREAYVIEAGEPVTVNLVHGGLTISATAVPLQPGALGDVVRLRNSDSGKIFTGIVMADGTIRVGG
jgi:flagella basal body P-ring formation protein FlgA